MMVSVRSPRKVELDQPGRLHVVLVELRDRRLPALFAVQRGEVRQHGGRDHDATGMTPGVARQPFEGLREVDEAAHLVLGFVQPAQFRLLGQRLLQRHADFERNQLGDPVREAVGMPQHAADVPHHGLRRHAAVGDDLGDAVATVTARHVIDHAVAAVDAEIDVEVRHRDPLRIKKSLEKKIVT
jgi:hypothetical protein